MKITRIRLSSLRNEEWFSFFTEFKAFVEKATAATLNIEELFVEFNVLYTEADVALEKIIKSAATELIAQADDKRDHTFRGLSDMVKANSNHFEATKREAASRIQVVLDHYGNVSKLSYSGETSSIYNLLQELNDKHAADVQALGLAGWLTELGKNNQTFETLLMQRNEEDAAQTNLRMLDVRNKLDRNYLNMVEMIEAQMLVNGESPYLPFVKSLNANVDRYNLLLAQRQGKSAAKRNGGGEKGEEK